MVEILCAGVIIGYIVYLSIALCNGELLYQTIDFVSIYLPGMESYILDLFPTFRKDSVASSQLDHRPSFSHQSSVEIEANEASNLQKKGRDRRAATKLYDDRESVAGSIGHIVGGDMSMSMANQTTYNSTGRTANTFADFGTTFRDTITSPVKDTKRDADSSKKDVEQS